MHDGGRGVNFAAIKRGCCREQTQFSVVQMTNAPRSLPLAQRGSRGVGSSARVASRDRALPLTVYIGRLRGSCRETSALPPRRGLPQDGASSRTPTGLPRRRARGHVAASASRRPAVTSWSTRRAARRTRRAVTRPSSARALRGAQRASDAAAERGAVRVAHGARFSMCAAIALIDASESRSHSRWYEPPMGSP